MKLSFSGLKIVIAVAFVVGVFLSLTKSTVSASTGVTCSSIVFTPALGQVALEYDAQGNIKPVSVKVDITVAGPQPGTDATFRPSDGYQIAYVPQGGNWQWIHLTLSQPTNPGTTEWKASTTFTIDKPGTWFYSLETRAQEHLIGTGAGCGPRNGDSNTVAVTIKDPVLSSGSILAQRCDFLPTPPQNYFTCFNFGSSSSPASWQGSSDSAGANNTCNTGFVPDQARCAGGTGLNPIYDAYCLPCKDSQVQVNSLAHFAVCDPNDKVNVCDQSDPGLTCLAATGEGDSGFRCLYSNAKLPAGVQCYIGTGVNECSLTDSLTTYTCLKTELDTSPEKYKGVCASVEEAKQCNNDSECLATESCVRFACITKGTDLNPGPQETQETCEAKGGAWDSGQQKCVDASNQFGPERCPQDDPQENASCVKCLKDGGTWTALGCIVTTPQGVFNSLVRLALGIMGGVALFRLIYLGYLYNFGGEDKIKPTRDEILATLGGLVLVTFSVLILRIIGVNVLDIVPPGFFGS